MVLSKDHFARLPNRSFQATGFAMPAPSPSCPSPAAAAPVAPSSVDGAPSGGVPAPPGGVGGPSDAFGRPSGSPGTPPDRPFGRRAVALCAVACGTAVATITIAQPLLATIADDLRIAPAVLGLLVAATQLGYAAGLVLLVPLGDHADRRRLILVHMACLAGALLAVAAAPTAMVLVLAMVAVGLAAVCTQLIVAFAAALSDPAGRGRTVGVVTSGVVLGILLSRTAAGAISSAAGWRAVYLVAAALTVVLAVLLARALPREARAQAAPPYGHVVAGTLRLFVREPVLRQRGVLATLVFAAFNVFWTGMALPLSAPPLALSDAAIGAFGLAGAAGALGAARAGRLVDAGLGPRVARVALVLLVLSWGPIAAGPHALWALAIGAVVLDFAVQAVHVVAQDDVFAIRPDAGSAFLGAYMVFYSAGSAAGALGATAAYAAAGWPAVCALGAGCSLAALAAWARGLRALRSTAAI